MCFRIFVINVNVCVRRVYTIGANANVAPDCFAEIAERTVLLNFDWYLIDSLMHAFRYLSSFRISEVTG
jgi:hypothetical protein